MKVCLIYLPHPFLVEPDAQAPLGLLYIASVLENIPDVEVELQNLSACKNDKEALSKLYNADIFGIGVTALELLQANDFARQIKLIHPDSKVILGGPGTSSDEYVNWDFIDAILKGEGEISIYNMLKEVHEGINKRIYYGQVVQNLDLLPFPARHLLKDKQGGYIFANRRTYDKTFSMKYKNRGTSSILTSRGCPFKCAFCSAPSLNYNIRFRSPQNVYDEIKYVLDQYKIKQFRFSDEMFTASKRHVKEICELIKPLGIVWRISARTKPLDMETLRTIREAGCVEVSFGIESFDDDVLKMLNKKTTALDNAKAMKMATEAGLMVRALFMIRTPGQTKDTVKKNIKWLKKVPYDTIAVTSFVPLPGSDIWNNPDKYNIEILNKNLADYNFYFYGSEGKNELKDIIKIKNRSLEEFNAESEYFREWIEKEGKTNRG